MEWVRHGEIKIPRTYHKVLRVGRSRDTMALSLIRGGTGQLQYVDIRKASPFLTVRLSFTIIVCDATRLVVTSCFVSHWLEKPCL